ncbi:hypothetical protein BC940DRAFT_96104 [Gongronella butleri]|nr:hypothetical protein BC940DRAFT_96104 [Gongronella butleri]
MAHDDKVSRAQGRVSGRSRMLTRFCSFLCSPSTPPLYQCRRNGTHLENKMTAVCLFRPCARHPLCATHERAMGQMEKRKKMTYAHFFICDALVPLPLPRLIPLHGLSCFVVGGGSIKQLERTSRTSGLETNRATRECPPFSLVDLTNDSRKLQVSPSTANFRQFFLVRLRTPSLIDI